MKHLLYLIFVLPLAIPSNEKIALERIARLEQEWVVLKQKLDAQKVQIDLLKKNIKTGSKPGT